LSIGQNKVEANRLNGPGPLPTAPDWRFSELPQENGHEPA
jgi:hypothetical protein